MFSSWKVRGGHVPEERHVLGELDDLLYHEGVDLREVREQGQFGDWDGQALVMDEQMSRRLQRSGPE